MLICLVFLGFGTFSSKAKGEVGVFGGPSPVSGAPAGFPEDKAMLASGPLPDPAFFPADTSVVLTDRTVLQITTLEKASGPGVPTNRSSGKESAGFGSDTGAFDPKAYFILPTQGVNWGKLHPKNAVDVANSCDAPAVASAQGLVTDLSLDSWSNGYGHYVFLSHPNGTKTRYAHLNRIFVSLGQYVKQGDLIGAVGRTGDASGCHVHFEVDGAANPFAR